MVVCLCGSENVQVDQYSKSYMTPTTLIQASQLRVHTQQTLTHIGSVHTALLVADDYYY